MSAAPVNVVFHRLAADEYRRARRYYLARAGAGIETRFIAAVDAAIQRITMWPMVGAPAYTHFRQIRVNRFSYVLAYRITSPTLIEIIAVAHTSRRPGYWRRRRP